MRNYFDKNLFQQVFNSNEFKGWLLSRRWFGEKSLLSNLSFKVTIKYFNTISEIIFLTIIEITSQDYVKLYFLPLRVYARNISSKSKRWTFHPPIIHMNLRTFQKKIKRRKKANIYQ